MGETNDQDKVPELTPAARAARQLLRRTKSTYEGMVLAFNEMAKGFWSHPRATPQEIAESMGSDAGGILEFHAKVGAFISSINPEDIAPGREVSGRVLYNEDGTVTVQDPNNP